MSGFDAEILLLWNLNESPTSKIRTIHKGGKQIKLIIGEGEMIIEKPPHFSKRFLKFERIIYYSMFNVGRSFFCIGAL